MTTRWHATYVINPDGPRIESVSIGAAVDAIPGGWKSEASRRTGTPRGEVRISQDLGPSMRLTGRMTRRIKPGEALSLALLGLRDLHRMDPELGDWLGQEWQAIAERALDRSTERHVVLAATAARYVAAFQAGERAPVKATADALGLRQAQVRDRLYKARQLGLLEPRDPGQGRAMGSLTQAAIVLLRKEGSE